MAALLLLALAAMQGARAQLNQAAYLPLQSGDTPVAPGNSFFGTTWMSPGVDSSQETCQDYMSAMPTPSPPVAGMALLSSAAFTSSAVCGQCITWEADNQAAAAQVAATGIQPVPYGMNVTALVIGVAGQQLDGSAIGPGDFLASSTATYALTAGWSFVTCPTQATGGVAATFSDTTGTANTNAAVQQSAPITAATTSADVPATTEAAATPATTTAAATPAPTTAAATPVMASSAATPVTTATVTPPPPPSTPSPPSSPESPATGTASPPESGTTEGNSSPSSSTTPFSTPDGTSSPSAASFSAASTTPTTGSPVDSPPPPSSPPPSPTSPPATPPPETQASSSSSSSSSSGGAGNGQLTYYGAGADSGSYCKGNAGLQVFGTNTIAVCTALLPANCGAQACVMGTGSGLGGTPPSTSPVTYTINNACAECCGYNGVDVASSGDGRWDINWHLGSCGKKKLLRRNRRSLLEEWVYEAPAGTEVFTGGFRFGSGQLALNANMTAARR